MVHNNSYVIRLGPPAKKRIALVFQGNKDQGYLSEVLTTLAKENVRSAFFLPGVWLKENPGLIAPLLKTEHELGGCSYSNSQLNGLTPEKAILEIRKFQDTARSLSLPTRTDLFKMPGDQYSSSILSLLNSCGYQRLIAPAVNTEKIDHQDQNRLNQFWNKVFKPGSIISFTIDQPQTMYLLPLLIKKARELEFTLLKLSELLHPPHWQDEFNTTISLPGETMFNIGERTGLNPKMLALLNRLPATNRLTPGQLIYLPLKPPYVYTISPGDSLDTISTWFNLSTEEIGDLNGSLSVKHLYPGEQILIPPKIDLEYAVQEDDTLLKISQQLAVPLYTLINLNSQLIQPGQRLKFIPPPQETKKP